MTPQSNFTTAASLAELPAGHVQRRPPKRRFKQITKKPQRYVVSAAGALFKRKAFASVETLCLFIGYARSGHSLIGSLLDAHRNAIIADELDALKYIQAGFSENQLFYLLLRNSEQSARAGRERTGYSYRVPGQWQGRFEELRVIGDKMGRTAAARFVAFPKLLDTLCGRFHVKTKFLHVIRNPYDIISTMALAHPRALEVACDRFFEVVEDVGKIKRRCQTGMVHDLRHEDFVGDPKNELRKVCAFLNLEPGDDYLDACARIVYKSPHKSREKISWSPGLIASVRERMSRIPFLSCYSFDD